MSAKNDFLPFAVSGSANVVAQSKYAGSEEQLNGMQPGMASSKLCNKVWRQASMMAAALGELVAAQGEAARDTGDVLALQTALTTAIKKLASTVNSASAVKLQKPRNINNVSFDGTKDIEVNDLDSHTTGCFRFRSGVQITYGVQPIPDGTAGTTITYTLPFINMPSVAIAVPVNYTITCGVEQVSLTGITIKTSSNDAWVRWMSIGRWR